MLREPKRPAKQKCNTGYFAVGWYSPPCHSTSPASTNWLRMSLTSLLRRRPLRNCWMSRGFTGSSDVGQDLLRHLAAFVLRQEILRGLGQGLARRPRHADAPLDVRKVHSGTTPPAAGGAYGCEPHRRLGAAREVGSASLILVDVSFDHAGELRVAVVGLLACPRQDVRLDLGAGIADLDQAFRTGPQVERLQRIA